jgi:NAD(P)-dependent dehydrogenase (short-subunit alcohol dehydrogenase family)
MVNNKVALVTGAGSGIGRAVALVWAREGAKMVVVSDTNLENGKETVALVQLAGGDAIFVQADVGKPEDARRLVDHTLTHFGRLDVACNNAGIGGAAASLADYPLEAWDEVIRVNLSGVFYGMQQQIKAMLRTGGGSIVNVASILGAVGFATASAYTAAKHGVLGLTQVAALEYGTQGIRVNAVGPGFIHTPMISQLEEYTEVNAMPVAAHPMARLGRPEEVADVIAWMSSDHASLVTGAHSPVDGGYLAG